MPYSLVFFSLKKQIFAAEIIVLFFVFFATPFLEMGGREYEDEKHYIRRPRT